ncbi:MAG: hypothetical protein HGA52_05110, partial [Bacteroidales bacterium]|nr:hypothetical protein [Bacteroidales bacterium]
MRKRVKSIRQKIFRYLRYDFETLLTFGFTSSHPYRQLSLGYFTYIVFGTILLCIPFMTNMNVNILDHVFTATSAISTTGLSTVDVSNAYSLWGQIVILIL